MSLRVGNGAHSIHVPRACGNCGKTDGKLKKCGQCKIALYCTVKCQRKAWPEHKKVCQIKKPETLSTEKYVQGLYRSHIKASGFEKRSKERCALMKEIMQMDDATCLARQVEINARMEALSQKDPKDFDAQEISGFYQNYQTTGAPSLDKKTAEIISKMFEYRENGNHATEVSQFLNQYCEGKSLNELAIEGFARLEKENPELIKAVFNQAT